MANVFDQFDDQENVFDQFDDQPEPGFLEKAATALANLPLPGGVTLGTAETLGTVGTGIAAEPVAGLAGAATAPFAGASGATDVIQGTRDFLTLDPVSRSAQENLQSIGRSGEVALQAIRAPVAGLAGVAQLPFEGVEGAADTVRSVTEEGIGRTAGGAVLEATGSPLLATAVDVLPTAIATVAGARAPKVAPQAAPKVTPRAAPADTQLRASVGRPTLDATVDVTPNADQIITRLKTSTPKKPGKIAEAVLPDKATIESAQRLGVDLNPEHYSTNAAFRDVARALKTQPGSKLEAAEKIAFERLSAQADDLVQRAGGSLDKGALSESIANEFSRNIDQLESAANQGYKIVRETIPAQTKVDPRPLMQHLQQKIDDFGGQEQLLSKSERQILSLIRPGKKKLKSGKTPIVSPTYAALDRVRRNVGDGFNKRSGPFVDDGDRVLRETYGVLSDVQSDIASSFGIGDLYASARGLVAKRKGLEDNAVALFGKDLRGTLSPQLRSTATALANKDVSRLNRLMEKLPESRRAEVAATLLDDLFSGGSRRGGGLGDGFVANFAALNRSPSTKQALFRYLPPEVKQRFNDIGRVLTGIVKANQKPRGNPSGTAAGIIKAMEDGGAIRRLYDVGKRAAVAEGAGSSVGVPGIGTASVIGATIAKGKTPVAVAADDLLSSPTFARAVIDASRGNVPGANTAIQNSSKFKKWATTIPPETAQRVASVGFIEWLVSEEQ